MDLFREIADMINPVKNAQILNEVQHGQHLYTITLGSREWQTTVSKEAFLFMKAFRPRYKGDDDESTYGEPFKFSSAPYSGSPINTVVNTKQ